MLEDDSLYNINKINSITIANFKENYDPTISLRIKKNWFTTRNSSILSLDIKIISILILALIIK